MTIRLSSYFAQELQKSAANPQISWTVSGSVLVPTVITPLTRLQGGTLHIYSGTIPATPDTPNGDAPLCSISNCNFLEPATVSAVSNWVYSPPWSGVVTVAGTAAWFRFAEVTSIGTEFVLLQGTCGTSGTDLILNSSSLTVAQTVTVTGFTLSIGVQVCSGGVAYQPQTGDLIDGGPING